MTTTNLTAAQIDSGLLDNSNTSGPRWAGSQITFSIPGANSTWDAAAYNNPAIYGAGEPFDANYGTLSSSQAANYVLAASIWDSYIAPSIVQVADNETSQGEIRVAFTDVVSRTGNNSYAYAGAPPNQGSTATPISGDIWIDSSHEVETFDQGTFAFQTLLHETGHTLGLKHSFQSPAIATGPNGENYDNYAYTVMSYTSVDYRIVFNFSADGGFSLYRQGQVNDATPMVADIQAVQDLYGADTTTNAGNDVYRFTDADFESRRSIYDAGGTNTLDFSQISRGSHIDLRPGATSDINYYSLADQQANIFAHTPDNYHAVIANYINDPSAPTYQWTNNLGIAFSTTIANVIGTAQADAIIGNTAANVITGGAGADTITGGGGNDVFKDTAANLDGDTITDFSNADVVNVTDADGPLVGLTYSGGILSFAFANAPSVTYAMTLEGATGSVHQRMDPNGGVDIYFDHADEPVVACYCTGTLILTTRGEVPVEALAVGDLVVTASGEQRPIRWIGHRRTDCARHPEPIRVMPVRIKADAVSAGVPARDLLVSPDHAVALDGVLVKATRLVNGVSIVRESVPSVTYWHIELDSHDLLLADGLAAESYIESDNRHAFANAGTAIQLHPDFEAAGDYASRTCLPLVEGGERLKAVRQALFASTAEGFTADPGLTVLADDVALAPVSTDGRHYRFDIPEGVMSLRLVSRSGIASEVQGNSGDHRRFGIMVGNLYADGVRLCFDDLGEGWNAQAPGRDHRWTNGDAALPPVRSLAFSAGTLERYPLLETAGRRAA